MEEEKPAATESVTPPAEEKPVEPETVAAAQEDGAPAVEIDVLARKQEDNIMAVIESLLFAYEKPLTIDQIKKVLDNLDAGQIRTSVEKLTAEYDGANRGMRIIEVAGGYKMISAPHFSSFLRKLFKGPQSSEKLSGPAMETLAIIAYKQPISKMEIEALRKINADGVVSTLMEKNLIRVTGRKDAPGRPKIYGTSKEFLEYFGLKSLEELPKMEQFPLSPEKQREILEKFAAEKNSGQNTENPAETPAPEAQPEATDNAVAQ